MNRRRWQLSLLACCTCLVGSPAGGATPDAGSPMGIVIISSDMRGYLGPCGCSENMRGGIARAAFQVAEARGAAPVLYLDCGDSLFPSATLEDASVPEQRRKAQALAEAMKRMGVAARTVGEKDDTLGGAFRQSLELPDQAEGPVRLFELSGHKVGVVSAQSATQLERAAKEARQAGAELVVALVHDTFEHAVEAAGRSDLAADLVVASHAPNELAGEENRLLQGPVPVAQLQSKGRSLLRLDVRFGGNGRFELLRTRLDTERELAALDERIALLKKQIDLPGLKRELQELYQGKLIDVVARRERIASRPEASPTGKNVFSTRFIPLEATLPENPEVQALVARYDLDVSRLNLAWAKEHGKDCPVPAHGEPAYVGNSRCRECHAESFPVWEGSKHAHAYEALAKRGKNYHLECVRCHVTGYGAPGGVCRVDRVANRTEVGCEVCHGPGSIHSDDPSDTNVVRNPGKELCVRCHDPENSPHFDFGLYLPEILGPGHRHGEAKKN